ncbi:uncharacterized protein LOC132613119 [Lycium barbarum]|uniref:uncharacterized protein LOC132613119 n=1 Tax=Lycium barbarum TaxID=112863 RepID=UPI00293F1E7B|nr:uncharacterized protein LOC132613119 [Lycium barbarum]
MLPNEVEPILIKKFGKTLSKWAMSWYSLFLEHSIHSFEMLADAFIKAHDGSNKVSTRKADIFKISQGDEELLREFVIRFQKEQMLLPAVPDECAVEAFAKGLKRKTSSALLKLKENLPRRNADYNSIFGKDRYQSYSQQERPRSRPERNRNNQYERPVSDRKGDSGQNRRGLQPKTTTVDSVTSRTENPRFSEYNFNIDLVGLVAAINKIDGVKRPRPMRSDLSQRDIRLFYDYHGTHGHRTDDCRYRRDEVARLLKGRSLTRVLE